MRIRPSADGDNPAIRQLLADSGLLTSDLDAERLQPFLVAEDEQGVVLGVVGIEAAGNVGLLRSLAASASSQKRGLGSELVGAAERHARKLGVRSLYLLTNTAEHFFDRLGYRPIERSKAPPFIRGTGQFMGLCPASSILMEKFL